MQRIYNRPRGVASSPTEGGLDHPIPQGFSLLLKPYIKVLTHSEKVGWWKSLMVECVSLFCLFIC